MHHLHLLGVVVVVLGISLVVVSLLHRARLPPIVGFLAVGILIGPGALGVIENYSDIELLAEVGVVLLLFSIGLELSLKELIRIRRLVFGSGLVQLAFTAIIVATIAWLMGFTPRHAIFWGALIGLSSTAIVLSLLNQKAQLSSAHGQGMLGILIFQDLAVVVLILLVPFLAGNAPTVQELGLLVAKVAGIIIGLAVMATYVFPWLMQRVVQSRQRELFTLTTIFIALGTAYVSGLAGLSLALGAFLAGLVISESPYSHQMLTEVLPFRDVFNSLFFVSVGMLFDPQILVDAPLLVAGMLLSVLVLKALVAGSAVILTGYGLRVGILVGLGLAQVGEFAFVLAHAGVKEALLQPAEYSLFIGVSVISMALTPLLFRAGDWLSHRSESFLGITKSPMLRGLQPEESGDGQERDATVDYRNHVIIVGYGLNGQNVARALRDVDVPFIILETNPATVRRFEGPEPIYLGDAARLSMLEHLGIERARGLVVAIGDAATTRRIVAAARTAVPELSIIVRTRYVGEMKALYKLGATIVVPEEFETSLALVGAVLRDYGVSPMAVWRENERIRRERYELLREPKEHATHRRYYSLDQLLHRAEVQTIALDEKSHWVAKPLRALGLREAGGGNIVGVLRGEDLHLNPKADWVFQAGDEVLVIGTSDELARVEDLMGHTPRNT